MMSQPWSKTFPAGTGTVYIDKDSTKVKFDGAAGGVQIVVNSIPNGTWGVDALFPDDEWRNIQSATLTAASVFTLDDKYVVKALRVIYANLGADHPVATVSVQGRLQRVSFGNG